MRIWLILLFFLISGYAYSTIDIAIYIPEGAVFASDGRVVSTDSNFVITDSYEKIASVTNHIMAQMQGNAYSDNKNLKAKIGAFKHKFHIKDSSNISVDSLSFLFTLYCKDKQSKGIDFGDFIIMFAGLDNEGAIKYCKYKPSDMDSVQWLTYGLYYYGVTNIPDRIIMGIDSELNIAFHSIIAKYLDSTNCDIDKIALSRSLEYWTNKSSLKNKIDKMLISGSMEDAINFAYTMIRITLELDSKTNGNYLIQHDAPHKAGGRILLCIVTRQGVRWVMPPNLKPSWRKDFDR